MLRRSVWQVGWQRWRRHAQAQFLAVRLSLRRAGWLRANAAIYDHRHGGVFGPLTAGQLGIHSCVVLTGCFSAGRPRRNILILIVANVPPPAYRARSHRLVRCSLVAAAVTVTDTETAARYKATDANMQRAACHGTPSFRSSVYIWSAAAKDRAVTRSCYGVASCRTVRHLAGMASVGMALVRSAGRPQG